ncbi:MAG TPA: hypothetical protein VFT79_03695 [Solirubrobacterales bacterium]|nr:hypothetical protein [Solirubrobacterales bacterium]
MEGRDEKRTEFKVVLEGVKLTEPQERAISGAIQGVVASQLAGLDFEGDEWGGILEIGGKFPDWRGGKWRLLDLSAREELQTMFERQR